VKGADVIDIVHIHPMLVHFPIVLFLLAIAAQLLTLVRGQDLTERACLPSIGLSALLLGGLAAVVAAVFGDIALDHAVDLGFPKGPLETHQTFGLTTTWLFVALAALQAVAWWRRIPLKAARGWIVALAGVVGCLFLLATAYYGGNLVYKIGVNVDAVKPAAEHQQGAQ
jgi:uncharacterized membrane protein